MKTRPILFNAPMVRAVLAGTKTQTRRAMRNQPMSVLNSAIVPYVGNGEQLMAQLAVSGSHCPYGQPGDRLWVRENFAYWSPSVIHYAADRAFSDGVIRNDYTPARFRPSIHMPRWASRITLEIVGVRVERLQDISEADALAEGVTLTPCKPSRAERMARDAYRALWESINGPGSWAANPWVWAVEFKRVKPLPAAPKGETA